MSAQFLLWLNCFLLEAADDTDNVGFDYRFFRLREADFISIDTLSIWKAAFRKAFDYKEKLA